MELERGTGERDLIFHLVAPDSSGPPLLPSQAGSRRLDQKQSQLGLEQAPMGAGAAGGGQAHRATAPALTEWLKGVYIQICECLYPDVPFLGNNCNN